jgi:tetratricopeptide (TPR) repeat protein
MTPASHPVTPPDLPSSAVPPAVPEATLLREANRAFADKRWTECEKFVQQVLAAQPRSVQAWRLVGALAFQAGRPAQAQAAFEKVLALTQPEPAGGKGHAAPAGPVAADDWFNLGSALDQPQRPDLIERAEQAYRKALALGPTQKDAVLRQLTALLRAQYRFQEARDLWQAELDVATACADGRAQAQAYTALGAVALEEGRWPAAKPLVEAACAADPTYAESQFSRALGLLAEGDFEAGWPAHEWRWQVSQAQGCWRDYGPAWTGDELGERILLVWAEQGLGDAMQFARFLPALRAAHPQAGLLLVCRRVLHPVLVAMAARERITLLPAEEALPGRVNGHDVHVPLLSLPLHLRCTLALLPPPAPLSASPESVALWRERVARFCSAPMPRSAKGVARGRALRQLGLVWSGSGAQAMAQRRNIRLADLEALLSVRGVQWHSLQLGPAAAEIATSAWQGSIVDWSHHLADFGDTAGLMACLDGVVSVDTACVHLAASLGRPAWMLSRFDACWRWMAPREDSPWYPSLRIFNQESPGEWAPVVRALGTHLNATA